MQPSYRAALVIAMAAPIIAGCVASGEPRMKTLSDYGDLDERESAILRGTDYWRKGEIERRGEDYVMRDRNYRTRYRLDRQSDGSYVIRDSSYRRLGAISAPNASGTRRVRDSLYRSQGTIRERDGESVFRDNRFRRRLEADLELAP